MARSESTPMAQGTKAPAFSLPDTRDGNSVSLENVIGQPVLIVFMCNHCPYVVHLVEELTELCNALMGRGLKTVCISANDVEHYPADAPERMAELASEKGFEFPYCFDETQSVARAYDAVCTPDIFLFDQDHRLFYHGQFDDTRPGQGTRATGDDLRHAVGKLLAGEPAPRDQKPSVGCSIKWKPV